MKKKDLELGIGDLVVYPTYGVGEIENFDSYDIDGSMQDFILINFKQDKMKLRIPKDKASSSGLRKLRITELCDFDIIFFYFLF